MKKNIVRTSSSIHKVALLLVILTLAFGVVAQNDDWYRPGGFDADGGSLKTFSVSATKSVKFSRGNLQYNAAQNKWRFAPRQYLSCCSDNSNIAEDYDGWIDLFSWGTSSWESGADEYQPWSAKEDYADYVNGDWVYRFMPGGIGTNNLTGDYANADWGVYNKITNGGNKEGQWRVLTSDEWQYLLNNHSRGFATIAGVFKGMVILPDDWTMPDGLDFSTLYSDGYGTNNYTIAEWHRMEAAGALFLPAEGCRTGTEMSDVGEKGMYWSSTRSNNEANALSMWFWTGNVANYAEYRNKGLSVRLVRDNRSATGAFDLDWASKKRFSVSATKSVRFSRGNLQYNAALDKWRFATQQYQIIGDSNSNIAADYDGWIDLFGWGTSGWNSGANAYQPWDAGTTYTDFYPGGYDTVNLTGDYANADWGVYNRISNGGNKTGKWRTLTLAEWEYLLGENAMRSGKWGLATIDGSLIGMVLLPDDWVQPGGVTFTAGYANSYNTNTYTSEQWQEMESAGALFLPSAGYREGTTIKELDNYGLYWSTTYYDNVQAASIGFSNSSPNFHGSSLRNLGFSVRLVKD